MASSSRRVDGPLVSELSRLIGQTRRLLWSSITAELRQLDESVYAWQLLNRLHRHGNLTQRELADSTAQHPAGVSRLLEELERSGKVLRKRSQVDRRKVEVALTAKGRATLDRMRPLVEAAQRASFAGLNEAEQRRLHDLLSKANRARGL